MKSFAVRIKQLRERKSWSQEELASAIGSSQRQISKYETGKNEPTAHVLDALADVLDTTADYILGRTDIQDRPLRGVGDLDPDEMRVIEAMRGTDIDNRRQIVRVVQAMVTAEPG